MRVPLLVLVLILMVVLRIADYASEALSSEDRKSIAVAVKSLEKAATGLAPKGRRIETMPVTHFLLENDIKRMLSQAHGTDTPLLYSAREIGPYMMSAQSVDKMHHLVPSFLEGYMPFHVENVMMPLYILSQRKSYTLDTTQYAGRADVWQSSRQAFLFPRGDCEDHAIILADWLIEMNYDARVVLGDYEGGGHAWVVLFKDGREYLLEATKKSGSGRNKPYPLAALHTNYRPKYMFNREYFWVNERSVYTTDYSGNHWQKKSRYTEAKPIPFSG